MRVLKMVATLLLGSVVCFAASYLVARLLLRLNNGFGAGDMSAFLYWTVLFSAALLLPAIAFAILLRNVRTINRVWVGVLLGGLSGFGWTFLNLGLLGPWFGAWSFNVLYCWIAGGAFSILAVSLVGRWKKRALP